MMLLIGNVIPCVSSDMVTNGKLVPVGYRSFINQEDRRSAAEDRGRNKGLSTARLMLFVEIPSRMQWGDVNFDVPINYKKYHSQINYSIYYTISDIKHPDVPVGLAKQLQTRIATDPILRSKLNDDYFCLGLIKDIQKKLPQYGCINIANEMKHKISIPAIYKLSDEYWRTLIDSGMCTMISSLDEDEYGFYCLQMDDGKKIVVDLDWIFFADSSERTWLDLMIKEGNQTGVSFLLKTNKFSKYSSSEQELLEHAGRNKLVSMVEKQLRREISNEKDLYLKQFPDREGLETTVFEYLRRALWEIELYKSIDYLALKLCSKLPTNYYSDGDWDFSARKICNISLGMIKQRCRDRGITLIDYLLSYKKVL